MKNTRLKVSSEGPDFSRIVAGVWKWGEWGHKLSSNEILKLIEDCVSLGVTTFDHADIYGGYTDEGAFGKALALQPSIREKIQIVTKCGIRMVSENRPQNKIKSYDTSKAYMTAAVENSLRELHTDRIDLLLIHRPDPLMNPSEIAETIEGLRLSGKVLHFGVSNFTPSQFEMLDNFTHLCTNQVEISLGHVDTLFDGTLDQLMLKQRHPMAWSPLGSGKFFTEAKDESTRRAHKGAQALAEKYNVGVDQLLLMWLLKHPSGVLPVLGTAVLDRIKGAIKTLDLEIEREDWFELLEAARGFEVP